MDQENRNLPERTCIGADAYRQITERSTRLSAVALISRDIRLVLIAYITAASSTDMVALAKAIFAGLGSGP